MILVKLTRPGSISTFPFLRPKSNSLILILSSLLWLWLDGTYFKRKKEKKKVNLLICPLK